MSRRRSRFPLARRAARRFVRREHGAVAVEFALLLPVMVLIFFGTIELSEAVLAKRRIYMGAGMLNDLVTHRDHGQDWVHEDDLLGMMRITERVLEPYNIHDARLIVTAVSWDEATQQPVVDWARTVVDGAVVAYDEEGYRKDDVFAALRRENAAYLDPNERIVEPSNHVIVTEIVYPYTSPFSNVVVKPFPMRVQEMRVPRRSFHLAYCDDAVCTDGRAWDPAENEPA